MTINWYVDKGLAVLDGQLRTRFPGIVIGTIGNREHQLTKSDHNPSTETHDYGAVDASDFMIDGIHFTANNMEWLFQTLLHWRDPRIAYVIYKRRIFSSTIQPWEIREYDGDDPHLNHGHLSVNDLHETDIDLWKLGKVDHDPMFSLASYTLPLLRYGMNDADYEGYQMIRRLQKLVNCRTVDGIYGPETAAQIKVWMGGGDGKTVAEREWVTIMGLSRRGPIG